MKNEAKFIISLLFACFSFYKPCLATEDTRIANQAMHCSAVFSILADAYVVDPVLSPKFGNGMRIFTEVYARERQDENVKNSTEIDASRRELIKQILSTLISREAYFREDTVLCGAWAEGFWKQGEHVQFILVYPKVVPMQVRTQYQTYADEAIKIFSKK